MESADSVTVRALFSNVYDPVNTVLAKPTGFDTDGANQKVARLNASSGVNKKTGPSLVLKVMAGDKVQISTYAFYNTPVQPPPGGVDLTSDILSLLSTGVVNNSAGKIINAAGVSTAVNPGVTQFLTNDRPYDNTRPKAYLNWILFDNQFNYIASNSGVKQAQPGASKQALIAPLQTIAKNGYLYVYVSNESQQDVYFDDLNVKHYTGPLVQEQSYYPFGLQMAGISDKALNKLSSQFKFDGGVELEEEYGVNLYSTFFRQYDPQLGRFSGVDILAEYFGNINPYQFAANDPVQFNDPSGAAMASAGPEIDPLGGMSLWAWVGANTGYYERSGGGGGEGSGRPHGGGGGGGGGKVYKYSVLQPGDGTDLDQLAHPGAESRFWPWIYGITGEESAYADFYDFFSLGSFSERKTYDAVQLLNHFLSGNGSSLHFGLNSYISNRISQSNEFKDAADAFEGAILNHLKSNSDLSSFKGNEFLDDNRPGYFGLRDTYLMTPLSLVCPAIRS